MCTHCGTAESTHGTPHYTTMHRMFWHNQRQITMPLSCKLSHTRRNAYTHICDARSRVWLSHTHTHAGAPWQTVEQSTCLQLFLLWISQKIRWPVCVCVCVSRFPRVVRRIERGLTIRHPFRVCVARSLACTASAMPYSCMD